MPSAAATSVVVVVCRLRGLLPLNLPLPGKTANVAGVATVVVVVVVGAGVVVVVVVVVVDGTNKVVMGKLVATKWLPSASSIAVVRSSRAIVFLTVSSFCVCW